MSVRQSLLAILDQGPCYGYQLRSEFDRRTGSVWPLNVGQIYNTLERLERDGLVTRGDTDEHGHVYWRITPAGSTDVRQWLTTPRPHERSTRDELAIKIAMATTLPGVDVTEIIRTQRHASLHHVRALQALRHPDAEADPTPEAVASALITEAKICAAEAEVRFLDRIAERLQQLPDHTAGLALSAERPKRGRPTKAAATTVDAATQFQP
ncbi:helix-turn-helix transcriptional regulator [Microbacterium sp. YY-01]|uniref:helix-turn-helix transcriptional regulator n=1 Tax=Microbacterium sp. YY-01 TaxID=3421634 RepID=UPI003D166B21